MKKSYKNSSKAFKEANKTSVVGKSKFDKDVKKRLCGWVVVRRQRRRYMKERVCTVYTAKIEK